jgi:hypothetical protein
MGLGVVMEICELEAGMIAIVSMFALIEPLRLKLNAELEPSGPVVPAAIALICDPDFVPAKLKVTGVLSII